MTSHSSVPSGALATPSNTVVPAASEVVVEVRTSTWLPSVGGVTAEGHTPPTATLTVAPFPSAESTRTVVLPEAVRRLVPGCSADFQSDVLVPAVTEPSRRSVSPGLSGSCLRTRTPASRPRQFEPSQLSHRVGTRYST